MPLALPPGVSPTRTDSSTRVTAFASYRQQSLYPHQRDSAQQQSIRTTAEHPCATYSRATAPQQVNGSHSRPPWRLVSMCTAEPLHRNRAPSQYVQQSNRTTAHQSAPQQSGLANTTYSTATAPQPSTVTTRKAEHPYKKCSREKSHKSKAPSQYVPYGNPTTA